jgi:hypothetical protein
MEGGDRVSVLGQPQHDWEDFLEDAKKPKKRWPLSKILLILGAVAVGAAVILYYHNWYGG